MSYQIINGDCFEEMSKMEESSVDAIVTDPPYGLAFMGAKWDSFGGSTGNQSVTDRQQEGKRYAEENKGAPRYGNSHGKTPTLDEMQRFETAMTPVMAEALRVAKPGAHLLCFGGTRTYHRMACAIEEAGWEIRDCIMWIYGSGFPKSMDVGKAINKALGAKRKTTGVRGRSGSKRNCMAGDFAGGEYMDTEPATDEAVQWDGWGTCLKPAWEPIIVARKPLDGTVAHNVMEHGTGALNIDGCRVPTNETWSHAATQSKPLGKNVYGDMTRIEQQSNDKGRFPANLVHDGSEEVLELFPESKGQIANRKSQPKKSVNCYGDYGTDSEFVKRGDSGSAARFFYCAKASKKDRNSGCEDLLTWEQGRELTQLVDECSQLLKAISECGMPKLESGECSTSLSGSGTTGLSPMECRCITSTVTKLTTESKTSDSSRHLSTSDFILDAIRTIEASGTSVVQLAERLSLLRRDSTKGQTDIAINAVAALFNALSEIRKLARQGNIHPTIKPNALMRWLVRLVCPVGGTVLDPFCGSGSTGVACAEEGMDFIGVEREEHYCDIAEGRLNKQSEQLKIF